MCRNTGCCAVLRIQTLAGKRAIGAELARQARQKPGCSYVGEKSNTDFRHGELEIVTGNAMRTVHRYADAAAHHDTVDQGNVRLAVTLDQRVERIFVAPELQRFILFARLAEIVERADVTAGRKRAASF